MDFEGFLEEMAMALAGMDESDLEKSENDVDKPSKETDWNKIMKSLEDAFDACEPEQLSVAIATKEGKKITIWIEGDEA